MLINVGSLRGGPLSSAGLPVELNGGGGSIEIVVILGCVGLSSLLEKISVMLEVVVIMELEVVLELVELAVSTVVGVMVTDGTTAPMPCDVRGCVEISDEVELVVLVDVRVVVVELILEVANVGPGLDVDNTSVVVISGVPEGGT